MSGRSMSRRVMSGPQISASQRRISSSLISGFSNPLRMRMLRANVRSNEGGLGIVEDDAFLAVEPARRLVDARDDGLEAEGEDLVAEKSGLGVEDLALPGEDVDDRRDLGAEHGSRRDDRRACGLAVRNRASVMSAEQGVEFGLRHAK